MTAMILYRACSKTFRRFFLCSSFFLPAGALYAQPVEYPLWPEGAPDSNGITTPETNENDRVSDVSRPTISVYLPGKSGAPTPAVVICPGGGYARLAIRHEGHKFAQWLNQQGIAAIVLKYRMPNRHSFVPLNDVQQAIRTVRANAAEWNIDPGKTGVAGFSAGGHLAGSASVLYNTNIPAETENNTGVKDPFKKLSARPDFSILVYPVISMENNITHAGSRDHLLGPDPKPALVELFTLYKQVNGKTPPTILFHSRDDKAVVPENSWLYYQALQNNSVPSKLMELPTGGHGWGMNKNDNTYSQWLTELKSWLKELFGTQPS